jgi:hypothetical protein
MFPQGKKPGAPQSRPQPRPQSRASNAPGYNA